MAMARSGSGSLVLVQAGALVNHDAIWNYLTHKQHSPGHHLIALGSIPPQRRSSGGVAVGLLLESCRLARDGRYASGTERGGARRLGGRAGTGRSRRG